MLHEYAAEINTFHSTGRSINPCAILTILH